MAWPDKKGTYRDLFENEKIIGSVAVGASNRLVDHRDPARGTRLLPRSKGSATFFPGERPWPLSLALVMAVASLKKTLSPLARLIGSVKDISKGNYDFKPQPEKLSGNR